MKTPFLGCAYYPEDWDESFIEDDIKKMKLAGIKCARIGEFAWRRMEPVRGQYDFRWLHKVVDALYDAGIAVVMGTPTATPPIWLSQEHRDVLVLNEGGWQTEHGGRRHCCSNNPNYLKASYEIVEQMAKEFGNDKAIIGWQLDNEIYSFGIGCVCGHCLKKYRDDLQKKYKTIENLNRQWNLNLFSQAYDSFDQIPPAIHAWHNPHMMYEWHHSHYDSDIAFMHAQADILRKYTSAPIGTDTMPINGMDYEKMNEKMDVVMFNHYNTPENLTDEIFWFDFLRNIKDKPFWNTETATTWNGSVAISQFLKPEGYCRVNSWLPVALGGESNMYWLWRQHWAGHELVHGSVISPEGRPSHVFGEVQRTAADFEKASEFINATRVDTPVAMHFTSKSWELFDQQPIFQGNSYDHELMAIHRSLMKNGVRPDVIGARNDLTKYKILFTSLQMTLEDDGMAEKIEKWVYDGGVWVAGPMTDIRNTIGAHYTDRAMGMIENMLGVELSYSVPTDGKYLKAKWSDGEEITVCKWAEAYDLKGNGESLAEITAGHTSLNGKSIISRHRYGKGEVILLGAMSDEEGYNKLASVALKDAGLAGAKTRGTLVVIPRSGNGEKGMIVIEAGNEKGEIALDGKMIDLLTGNTYEGDMEIAPYGVYVLKEIK
ncbi:MAG: hypothetical protein E7322_06315 [Clostridiales bacterium]|nr:hypothetical protein [Clostridiales bacterium]